LKNIRAIIWTFVCCTTLSLIHSTQSGTVGPDAFGYIADGTATFDFHDISTTGTNVGAGDESTHGPFQLEFLFRFYGFPYRQVYLSSNGWISFSNPGVPAGSDATNNCDPPIPNVDGQDNLIAGIWDDLDPTAPGWRGLLPGLRGR